MLGLRPKTQSMSGGPEYTLNRVNKAYFFSNNSEAKLSLGNL